MKTIFISHSAEGDPLATLIRDGIRTQLHVPADGFETFVDHPDLRPGQQWRLELHRRLATCTGSVILLSRKAITTSAWVRKEATILSYYATVDPARRLVPVLLDGITDADLKTNGYGPLRLSDFQLVALQRDLGERAEDYARRVILRVCEGFRDWQRPAGQREGADNVRRWLDKIEAQLEAIPTAYVREGAEKLGIAETLQSDQELREAVAVALINSDLPTIHRALRILTRGARRGTSGELLSLVTPAWVDLAVSRTILPVMQEADARRFVTLNSNEMRTGCEHVYRATCCDADVETIEVLGIVGEEPDELFEETDAVIRRSLGLRPRETLAGIQSMLAASRTPIVMFLGDNLCQRDILPRLRKRYPSVTFFLLAGDRVLTAKGLGIDALYPVVPPLDPPQEDHARAWISRIEALADGEIARGSSYR